MLKKLLADVQADEPKSRLVLFGSHAKGLAHKDSDLDLCLIFPNRVRDIQAIGNKISIELNFHRHIAADVLVCYERDYQKNRLSPILHEIRTYGVEI